MGSEMCMFPEGVTKPAWDSCTDHATGWRAFEILESLPHMNMFLSFLVEVGSAKHSLQQLPEVTRESRAGTRLLTLPLHDLYWALKGVSVQSKPTSSTHIFIAQSGSYHYASYKSLDHLGPLSPMCNHGYLT